ncbi:hypothetical protein HN51_028993 [Arachis hypogaea]
MFIAEKSKELATCQGQNKAFKLTEAQKYKAIEERYGLPFWVQDYVSLFYPTDNDLKKDLELQNWWKETVEVGHGDLKDKPWWTKMQIVKELVESCTTIIWTASALHAAINFGQYPYGGLIHRPTLSRRLLPEQGTAEYEKMVKSHQKAYLRTITPKLETLIDLTTIEILSKHASDDVYLGERNNPHWTFDSRALQAFQRFRNKLSEIEEKLTEEQRWETDTKAALQKNDGELLIRNRRLLVDRSNKQDDYPHIAACTRKFQVAFEWRGTFFRA